MNIAGWTILADRGLDRGGGSNAGDDGGGREEEGKYSHHHLLAAKQRVADELASSQGNGSVVIRHGCCAGLSLWKK
jgi:hypothetical protein